MHVKKLDYESNSNKIKCAKYNQFSNYTVIVTKIHKFNKH